MHSNHALSERLLRHRGSYSQIARSSGISASWLSMFARGQRGKRPSYDLIQRLIAALDAIEATPAKVVAPPRLRKARGKAAACRAPVRKRP